MVVWTGFGACLAFLVVWAVLVQNLSQLLPLLRIKLVIIPKAWYKTACWRGMFWYKGGGALIMIDDEDGGVVVLWWCGFGRRGAF